MNKLPTCALLGGSKTTTTLRFPHAGHINLPSSKNAVIAAALVALRPSGPNLALGTRQAIVSKGRIAPLWSRVVDDRSPHQSYHHIASAEWGFTAEAALLAEARFSAFSCSGHPSAELVVRVGCSILIGSGPTPGKTPPKSATGAGVAGKNGVAL